jgi:hypothetical protein
MDCRVKPGNDDLAGECVVKPKFADRFIDSIEFLAALFVGVVAADVFV